MSEKLVDQIRRFVNRETSVEAFVDAYIDSWRAERDDDSLLLDDDRLSEFLSSAFCVVDLYNPSGARREYELDESQLHQELVKIADEHEINL